jgi:hypothetical protein
VPVLPPVALAPPVALPPVPVPSPPVPVVARRTHWFKFVAQISPALHALFVRQAQCSAPAWQPASDDSDLLPQEAVDRTEIAKSTPKAFEYFE